MGKNKDKNTFDLGEMLTAMKRNTTTETVEDYSMNAVCIYASNVNLKRHICEIKDSLKPVYRRIMMTMFDLGLYPNKYSSASSIVGECLKVYHPHGESSVYEVVVNLSQIFRNNVQLVEGNGNMGSALNPKGYAAHRYTKAAMSEFAYDCFFRDWKPKNVYNDLTVDYNNTFDDNYKEPLYLPARYPLFLINWHKSMGVGKFTCTPGFGVTGACEIVKSLVVDAEAQLDVYPDCPQGCTLINKKDIKGYLDNINTRVKMRANYRVEEVKGKTYISIYSVPFEVQPQTIYDGIANLHKNGYLPEIVNIGCDKTDLGRGFSIDIEVKKGYDPHAIMIKLYKKTMLENTYSTKYAFVDELQSIECTPRIAILEWIRYRINTIKRGYIIQRKNNSKRIHVLEGIIGMFDKKQVEAVIETVRKNKRDEAYLKLMKKFGLTDYQASKILDMKITQLSEDDYGDFCKEIKSLEKDNEKILKVLKKKKHFREQIIADMDECIAKYGNPRKSKICQLIDSIKVADTEHYLIFTTKYVKKIPYDVAGYKIGRIDNGDKILKVIAVNNRDTVLVFDKSGRLYKIPVNDIGNTSLQSVGISLDQLGVQDIFVNSFILNEHFVGNITTITKNGLISNTNTEDINSSGKKFAITKLSKEDELVGVIYSSDEKLLIYTENGKALMIKDSIDPTGKGSKGINGIRLDEGDSVKGIVAITKDHTRLLVATDRAYMKHFSIKNMPQMKRFEAGIEINSGNGKVISVVPINKSNEILYGFTNEGAFEFDPYKIKCTDRIGKNERTLELSSNTYLFDIQ